MESLNTALHTYFVVGICYNILSQVLSDLFDRKLAPTDPPNGALIVSLVYMIFLLQDTLPDSVRTFLLVVWILGILRFGIFQHLLNYDAKEYLSRLSWIFAIAINAFGVAFLMAHLGMTAI